MQGSPGETSHAAVAPAPKGVLKSCLYFQIIQAYPPVPHTPGPPWRPPTPMPHMVSLDRLPYCSHLPHRNTLIPSPFLNQGFKSVTSSFLHPFCLLGFLWRNLSCRCCRCPEKNIPSRPHIQILGPDTCFQFSFKKCPRTYLLGPLTADHWVQGGMHAAAVCGPATCYCLKFARLLFVAI